MKIISCYHDLIKSLVQAGSGFRPASNPQPTLPPLLYSYSQNKKLTHTHTDNTTNYTDKENSINLENADRKLQSPKTKQRRTRLLCRDESKIRNCRGQNLNNNVTPNQHHCQSLAQLCKSTVTAHSTLIQTTETQSAYWFTTLFTKQEIKKIIRTHCGSDKNLTAKRLNCMHLSFVRV